VHAKSSMLQTMISACLMCFIKEYLIVKTQNFCHLIDERSFYNEKRI
jgi:hypothetical protein